MTNPLLRTGIVACVLMLFASLAAPTLRPTHMLADDGPKVDLETLIPAQFADWKIDASIPIILPSPDLQAALNKIYNQTLARTYINGQGERIMLSIAYGGDQSDTIKLHRPEGCYAGQGFDILKNTRSTVATSYGEIPVANLVAKLNRRNEPITYWIVIGDEVVLSDFAVKKVKLRYAMHGEIPDGMLMRVSSISTDEHQAYDLHKQFIDAMVQAVEPGQRWRVIGAS